MEAVGPSMVAEGLLVLADAFCGKKGGNVVSA